MYFASSKNDSAFRTLQQTLIPQRRNRNSPIVERERGEKENGKRKREGREIGEEIFHPDLLVMFMGRFSVGQKGEMVKKTSYFGQKRKEEKGTKEEDKERGSERERNEIKKIYVKP